MQEIPLSEKEEESLIQEVLDQPLSKDLNIKNAQWKKCSEGLKTYRTKYKEMKDQMKEEEKKAKAQIRIEYNRKIKEEMRGQKEPISKQSAPKQEIVPEKKEEEIVKHEEQEQVEPIPVVPPPTLIREPVFMSATLPDNVQEKPLSKRSPEELFEMFEMYEKYKKQKKKPRDPSPESVYSSSEDEVSQTQINHVAPVLKTDSRLNVEQDSNKQKFFFMRR